nr:MAG TPA: hypothetical protein [Caudoviricetes sp.]
MHHFTDCAIIGSPFNYFLFGACRLVVSSATGFLFCSLSFDLTKVYQNVRHKTIDKIHKM